MFYPHLPNHIRKMPEGNTLHFSDKNPRSGYGDKIALY